MTDDLELRRSVERAEQAKRLIEDPVLSEAFAAVRQACLDEWQNTHGHESERREQFWHRLKAVDLVWDALKAMLRDGTRASARLKERGDAA